MWKMAQLFKYQIDDNMKVAMNRDRVKMSEKLFKRENLTKASLEPSISV